MSHTLYVNVLRLLGGTKQLFFGCDDFFIFFKKCGVVVLFQEGPLYSYLFFLKEVRSFHKLTYMHNSLDSLLVSGLT